MTLTLINQSVHCFEDELNLIAKYQPNSLTEQMVMTILKSDLVTKLIKHFPDSTSLKDYQFQDGTALIHQAAKTNANNCLQYLIDSHNDVNLISKSGMKPLEYAIKSNANKACEMLRAHDAKAFDKTLSELVTEDKAIAEQDRCLLLEGVDFINEYQAVLVNLRDYLNQLCLCVIEDKDDRLLFMSMKLIMIDHQAKLVNISKSMNAITYESILHLLDKYQLTEILVKPFKDIYDKTLASNSLINVISTLSKIDNVKMIRWEHLERCYSILADH